MADFSSLSALRRATGDAHRSVQQARLSLERLKLQLRSAPADPAARGALQANIPQAEAALAAATVGSRLALRVDVAATNFVLPEAKLSPAAIGTNVEALAGTVIGQRYGTATEVTALGDTVAKELGNFLGGESQIEPNSPISNYQAEYTKPDYGCTQSRAEHPPTNCQPYRESATSARRRRCAFARARRAAISRRDVRGTARHLAAAHHAWRPGGAEQPDRDSREQSPLHRVIHGRAESRVRDGVEWREYPTDQRGTCFRQFWDTSKYIASSGTPAEREKYLDIARLHQWTRPLGQNRPIAPASPVLSSITEVGFERQRGVYPSAMADARRHPRQAASALGIARRTQLLRPKVPAVLMTSRWT